MATHRSTACSALLTIACGLAVSSALVSTVSCTAILAPRDDVERCGSADDCPDTNDNRYIAECRFDEGSSLDSTEVDKICVAAYKPSIGCNEMNYTGQGEEHPYKAAFDDNSSSTRYSCDMTPGVRGCPPDVDNPCADGLELNEDEGFCDDPDASANNPTISLSGNSDLRGQDVRDQFCRSFFCDKSFVCDTTDFTCVPCDPEQPFGEGGCGTVYVAGQPSCIYTANLEDVCEGPGADTENPKFGDCSGS